MPASTAPLFKKHASLLRLPNASTGSRPKPPTPASSAYLDRDGNGTPAGWRVLGKVVTNPWNALKRPPTGTAPAAEYVDTPPEKRARLLPTELVEEILEYLEDDPPSLATCSLVCRTWFRLASPLLWHDPKLHSSDALVHFARLLVRTSDQATTKSITPWPSFRATPQHVPSSFDLIHSLQFNLPYLRLKRVSQPRSTKIVRWIGSWRRERLWNRMVSSMGIMLVNLKRLHILSAPVWLTDKALEHIVQSCGETLEELGVANAVRITDKGMEVIAAGCKSLKKLDVSRCLRVGDAGVVAVAEARKQHITGLDLAGCQCSDVGVMAIAMFCSRIVNLSLEDCFMLSQRSICAVVNHCSEIESLKLPCFIYPHSYPPGEVSTYPIVQSLLNKPTTHQPLKSLTLSMVHGLTLDEQLPALLRKHTSLRELDLFGSIALSAKCASAMSNLTHLVLASTGLVEDEFAKGIAEHCHALVHLDLSYCQITAVGAGAVIGKCGRLRYCSFAFNRALRLAPLVEWGDRGYGEEGRCGIFADRARSFSLTALKLCQVAALSDACVRALPRIAPNLTDLDLSYCQEVSDEESVLYMVRNLPLLSKLNISCCDTLLGTVGVINGHRAAKSVLKNWSETAPVRHDHYHDYDRHRFCLITRQMSGLRAAARAV
ncbi:hypothetical protein HK104_001538 [Borealophlyctis nickersoniae]|nr:hypothetical protein HK104_001538 [Borealophlyctis nickersoniae]